MALGDGAVIVSGARTPIGKMLGGLSELSATQLGGVVIRAALDRAGAAGADVDYVIMGQVLQAGAGQMTARQAAVAGGVPMGVPALTINKVCLSGLDAIALADQLIRAGEFEVIVAGGMESMTNAPHLLPKARRGLPFGSVELLDSTAFDGLTDPFDHVSMGASTEEHGTRLHIARAEQDAFAARSHQRAAAAHKNGLFDDEIVPVNVPQRRGEPLVVSADEGIRADSTTETLAKLKPAFAPDGTITAGNASQLSDGACAVLVTSRAVEKHLDTAYVFEGDVPGAIQGDVTRLRQIILNLLANAVKFTDSGEVVLTVSTESPADGHVKLTFAVRDTGIGLTSEGMSRLFQSFSQADSSTTRKYGGTGLGLAISRRLAELMGGRMWAESEGPGKGSTFLFTIEVPTAAMPPARQRDFVGVQPALQGKRVLVVDDNATNRRILELQTAKWGMSSRATESPLEALQWLASDENFDLAILDMHMPEMDGVALARKIRAHHATLPLVLFSSLGRREAGDDQRLFNAYLTKPIRQSHLFDTLVGLLAHDTAPKAAPTTGKSQLDPGQATRHPLRILLAEDNVVNQKLALRLLQQMGYRADLASNGIEAVESVQRQTYDVVLMDVQMPEMDGLEASRQINARWQPQERPRIIAMTANAMQGDRDMCLAAGMDDYVTKPIRVEQLVEALNQVPARQDR